MEPSPLNKGWRLWKRFERDVDGVAYMGLVLDHDAVKAAEQSDGHLAAGECGVFLFDEGADLFRGGE
jgi:hypothetical protein